MGARHLMLLFGLIAMREDEAGTAYVDGRSALVGIALIISRPPGKQPYCETSARETEQTNGQPLTRLNSVQIRCIVKGEAQESPLFWRFSGVFDFLRSACSLRFPQENL